MSHSSPDPFQIASTAEAEIIAVLARRIWSEAYASMLSREQIDHMLFQRYERNRLIRTLEQSDCRYWLVREGERSVGYGSMELNVSEGGMKIREIYLLESVRGSGLAQGLLETMIETARRHEARWVWLTVNRHNSRALRFYQRCGFETVRECVSDIGGGFVMDDYVMEKTIRSNPGPGNG